MSANDWLEADWPAPAKVRTLATTRSGGVSQPPYASLNLGAHVGDEPEAVAANRARLRDELPAEPAWLNQVHGVTVVDAAAVGASAPDADASFSRAPGVVCAAMTADCLPVLLCDEAGTVVAAAHAGWRGLCEGVIEAAVAAMNEPPSRLMAWLGPAIGPDAFEVGAEVRQAFLAQDPAAEAAFVDIDNGKYLADIYALARLRLEKLGVARVYGGDFCTVIDRDRFFSYRRDGVTGRMASLIWLEN
ncbi:peptidoglycan editing factor PgeF [Chromobacterium alticapitis]|uniref:Purine nucleoside phosphorylase n=1 Tax=Chromobacterium alticapitis TaxID=2073169 RepID=A0A2S5DB11_9NEIS|nr:peptidoglycan editing factor PgeF [Chromobacterium alticapitis]POZ60275.1 peptidoglycan editing factor PgeF [Chromobacterium alticapitis]